MTRPSDACSIRQGAFFGVDGGLHAVSWGWCWDYLDAVLMVSEGSRSSMASG